MPQLGESVTEGTISKWLVSVGDRINKYDSLAEVMTDKVTAEIPASFAGVIIELSAAEGDTLSVGEIICKIEVVGGAEIPSSIIENEKIKAAIVPVHQSNKVRYSPAVLKLSQEHGIDLTQIQGTGAEGRITRKDLLKLVELGLNQNTGNGQHKLQRKGDSVSNVEQSVPKPVDAPLGFPKEADIEIPVTGIRKVIAEKMLQSKQEVPHAWTMIEVDVTNLVELRNSLKEEFRDKEGFNLTFFAFFVKAVSQALKEFPQINSMWAGDKIIRKKEINISIAVATESALFVPVIKNADDKTIKAIAKEIAIFAKKAQTGKFSIEDVQGGTFTVNNTGSFGSVQSMGIINHPQSAILQVESIIKRPIVVNQNMIAIRDMVNLCMSLDHRVLDGLICGRFLSRLKGILENISKYNASVY